MPNTRTKGAPLYPYDPEFQQILRNMVNAQELEAYRHKLGLEAEIDAVKNVRKTVGINQPRSGAKQPAGINQPRVVDDNRGGRRINPSTSPISSSKE